MTTELATLLAVVSGVVVLIAGAAWWWISRPAPVTDRANDEVLPLFSGSTPASAVAPDVDLGPPHAESARTPTPPAPPEATPGLEAPRAAVTPTSPAAPASTPASAAPERTVPAIREFTTGPAAVRPVPPFAPPGVPSPHAPSPDGQALGEPSLDAPIHDAPSHDRRGAEVPVVDGAGVPGTMVEGHTLRFGIPADGTLQFLPGRLEIRSGLDAGREIRFVRTGGGREPEVTFGRTEGEPYRHIQLRDRTVSRRHASLRWQDGHWCLENQSTTNPVVHNGRELGEGEAVVLAEGDRIEMGEVQFTYRLPP